MNSPIMPDTREQCIEELKKRFPAPWFNDWTVHHSKTADDVEHFSTFIDVPNGGDEAYLVPAIADSMSELLIAIQAIPLPAPETPEGDGDDAITVIELSIRTIERRLGTAAVDCNVAPAIERIKQAAASLRTLSAEVARLKGEREEVDWPTEESSEYQPWWCSAVRYGCAARKAPSGVVYVLFTGPEYTQQGFEDQYGPAHFIRCEPNPFDRKESTNGQEEHSQHNENHV